MKKPLPLKRGAKVSIQFLERVAKLFGLDGGASFDAAGKAQDDATFSFANVQSLYVEPAIIEASLNSPSADRLLRERFTPEEINGRLVHVAYEYLYSNKIQIRVGADVAGEVNIAATVTDDARMDAGAATTRRGGSATLYDDKEPIAFAFSLAQISFDKRYFVRSMRSVQGSGFSPTDVEPDRYVVETGRIFDLTAPSL